ncbi:hypothetical protein B0H19DRAFT_1060036 [Mycena capillaripes]|nr:hypothetical protein B0H19DRAFT_1060036 [Mycena capillaripes]
MTIGSFVPVSGSFLCLGIRIAGELHAWIPPTFTGRMKVMSFLTASSGHLNEMATLWGRRSGFVTCDNYNSLSLSSYYSENSDLTSPSQAGSQMKAGASPSPSTVPYFDYESSTEIAVSTSELWGGGTRLSANVALDSKTTVAPDVLKSFQFSATSVLIAKVVLTQTTSLWLRTAASKDLKYAARTAYKMLTKKN